MRVVRMTDQEIELLVDRLFDENPPLYDRQCTNPVTGGHYVGGLDPIEPQKYMARLALRARTWFAVHGPADAPPLPLSHGEREDLKIGGLPHIVAWYARSLEGRDYDQVAHPSFYDYACGVLASDHAPGFIKTEDLRKCFPPRRLTGLGPGLYWEPPAVHAKTVASYRRSLARVRAAA